MEAGQKWIKLQLSGKLVYLVIQSILPYFVFCEKIKNPDCRNQDFTVFFSSRWCHQESNRGHKDFQSCALPTELWHHYFLFAVAKVVKVFNSANLSTIKNTDKKLYCLLSVFLLLNFFIYSLVADSIPELLARIPGHRV